jgi:hypothetical protein
MDARWPVDQDAANFLKERICRQAQAEGMPLSQEEEMFLELAGAGRSEEAREALKRLKEHESMLEFGRRMAGLLMRAYEEDLKSDPQAREKYLQHSHAFGGGSSLFSTVLPLIVGRRSDSQQGPPQQRVSPESSTRAWMLLLIFLIAVGMILWIVISRR